MIFKSEVSKAPEATSRIAGADTELTLKTRVEFASLLKTATIVSSIPARFPWLSSMGTVIIILKEACADSEFCELFDGVKYGSEGATITEFARIVGGGKLKVDQTPAFVKIVAISDRRVVIAAVILSHHRRRRGVRSKQAPDFAHQIITHAVRIRA